MRALGLACVRWVTALPLQQTKVARESSSARSEHGPIGPTTAGREGPERGPAPIGHRRETPKVESSRVESSRVESSRVESSQRPSATAASLRATASTV